MFNTLLYEPIFNLVVFLYKILGQNLGLSIIAVAIFSRLVTFPILSKQMKSSAKMREMKPKLDKLKKKYKDNPQKMNEEQMKLYKEMGVNPIGGCLPMIVQLVFLIYVRKVVVELINGGISAFNSIAYFDALKFAEGANVNTTFLGMDMGKVATDFAWDDTQIIPYVLLALAVGVTQLFSTKLLMPSTTPVVEEHKDKKKDSEPDSMEMMTKSMTSQMTFLMPIMTVFMALGFTGGSSIFSAALSLFWTVQNLFVILQRLIISPKARKNLVSNLKGISGKLKFNK